MSVLVGNPVDRLFSRRSSFYFPGSIQRTPILDANFRYIPDRHYSAHIGHTPTAELPYTRERQGESVCWDKYGHGYFTLSEGSHPPLYYYQRSGTASVVG